MKSPAKKSKAKSTAVQLLPRHEVMESDTWNLTPIFKTPADWEAGLKKLEKMLPGFAKFKGKLGTNAKTIKSLLEYDAVVDRLFERLAVYAHLMTAGDTSDSDNQRRSGRLHHLGTKLGESGAFIRPELLAIPEKKMQAFLKSADLKDWKLALERTLRYRPHTLSNKEEELLAKSGQIAGAAGHVFRQLNDADLKFGTVKNEKGEAIELGHATWQMFMHSPKRSVREQAFKQYYGVYENHKYALAASLNGSNQRDVFYAKARGHKTARESALFHDNMPLKVYDNLVATVRKHLPALHRYYALRKKMLNLKDIRAFDVSVPLQSNVEMHHTWEEASDVICKALEPLGEQYCLTLREGLGDGRWADRYPNRGKQSGAFSYGTFDAPPYMMMNFQPTVLDHVFTLAHEAGHSMHSWYSVRNQPFQYYHYTIFVAEVASTFNEQLLAKYLIDRAKSKKERAYLISKLIDDIRNTIIRQTMFAEFEVLTHELVEKGEPLTIDALRKMYRGLLDAYFGPDFAIDSELELECLRIPHFYGGFYVYKYATGLSAAIALSERVLKGGKKELDAYLGFLKAGGSKWPLDILRDAGVDMEKPAPIEAAMKKFAALVDELESLL